KRKFLKKTDVAGHAGKFEIDSNRLIRPKITENGKVLPQAEIDAIPENYEKDLNEIVTLARENGKIIIYVSVCSNEMFPPYFSACSTEEGLQDISSLNSPIEEVEALLQQHDSPDQAEQKLEGLIEKFPRHAYINYLLGCLLFRKGEYKRAWKYLETSVHEDGFPIRAIPDINYLAKKVADKSEGAMIYVDHRSQVRSLLEGGMSAWDLFSDWYHPSFLNHILMARSIFCAISEIKSIQIEEKEYCNQLSCDDASRLAELYEKEMNVKKEEFLEVKRVVRWAIRISRLSAHPQGFYERANMLLPQYYYDLNEKSTNLPLLHATRACFLALLGEPCHVIEEHFNKAVELDKSKVEGLLDKGIDVIKGEDIIRCLNNAGLHIERDENSQIVRATCSN
ncbi:MAG: hypothetical protein HOI47_05290, partial [Candidatus Scalindua sp.]|nr:hypothetical protein [Candidatus Scalindua sp.]